MSHFLRLQVACHLVETIVVMPMCRDRKPRLLLLSIGFGDAVPDRKIQASRTTAQKQQHVGC